MAMTCAGSASNTVRATKIAGTPRSYTVPPPRRRCSRTSSGSCTPDRRVAAERLGRADGAAAHLLEQLLVRGVRLHVVGDHQLHAVRLTGAEHAAALVRGERAQARGHGMPPRHVAATGCTPRM